MDIKIEDNSVFVFDLDDTLYHEIDYLKSAYKEIAKDLEPLGWKLLYAEMFSLYRSKENVFDSIAKRYDIPVISLIEKYRNHKPDIQLFDGAKELLELLASHNLDIALVTDGRSITQRNKIESLGITQFFSKVIISEELGTEKPNLNNFKVIEEAFGKKNYYYIADNLKKDFVAPHKLGWKTIGIIDDGLNIHNTVSQYLLEKHIPDVLCFGYADFQIVI